MKRPVLIYVSFALLAFVLSGLALDRAVAARDDSYKFLSNFSESLELVQKNYVEPAQLDRLMLGAYRGLVEAFDPDTFFLDAAAARRYREPVPADRAGIGVEVAKRHGYAYVLSVWSAGPSVGQISPGDYIRVIDGASTREMSTFDIRERLAGGAGSEIALKVLRRQSMETKELKLKRAPSQAATLAARSLPDGVEVLRFERIDESVLVATRAALAAASARAEPGAVVLDLRACATGRLADGARLADLFLDSGAVLRLYGRTGEDAVKRELAGLTASREETRGLPRAEPDGPAAPGKVTATPTPAASPTPSALVGYEYRVAARSEDTAWKGALAVLIDVGTAGAAEVAAAALRDAGRAELIGARSFGRGAITDLVALEDGAALRLTVARALSPKGRSLLGSGIEPDEVVEPAAPDAATDPVLDKALERLKADGRVKKAA